MQPAPGTVIDKYALLRQLGAGGMGEVYEARHTLIDRRCAIKILRAELAKNAEVAERLLREARAAAAIGHPNIVETFDFGVTTDGITYLVMEYLDGQSLDVILDEAGRLAVRPTVAILVQVLSALVAAHDKGIVHRDLKPENIFIARGRRGAAEVKLLDFGISKFSDLPGEELRLTKTGMVVGTPFYMSPEQATDTQNVDARTDLWSAGVILYECLTGRLPYEAKNYNQQIVEIVTGTHTPPREIEPTIPEPLAAVVERALQKNPADRFASAARMIEALSPYYDREAVEVGHFSLQPSLLAPAADPAPTAEWVEYSLPNVLGAVEPREPLPGDTAETQIDRAAPEAEPLGPNSLSPSQVIGSRQPSSTRWRLPLVIGGGTFLLIAAGVLIAVLASRGGRHDNGRSPTKDKPARPRPAMTLPPAEPPAPAVVKRKRPAKPRTIIQLQGLPPEALVFFDGHDAANPIELIADDKPHTVKVEAPGFEPFERRVTARPGRVTIPVEMARITSAGRRRRHAHRAHHRHFRRRPHRPRPAMTMSGLYDDPHGR